MYKNYNHSLYSIDVAYSDDYGIIFQYFSVEVRYVKVRLKKYEERNMMSVIRNRILNKLDVPCLCIEVCEDA